MMGGNPQKGWCYMTRKPGFLDTIQIKQDLNEARNSVDLIILFAKLLELVYEKFSLSSSFNIESENPKLIGKESVLFRISIVISQNSPVILPRLVQKAIMLRLIDFWKFNFNIWKREVSIEVVFLI